MIQITDKSWQQSKQNKEMLFCIRKVGEKGACLLSCSEQPSSLSEIQHSQSALGGKVDKREK